MVSSHGRPHLPSSPWGTISFKQSSTFTYYASSMERPHFLTVLSPMRFKKETCKEPYVLKSLVGCTPKTSKGLFTMAFSLPPRPPLLLFPLLSWKASLPQSEKYNRMRKEEMHSPLDLLFLNIHQSFVLIHSRFTCLRGYQGTNCARCIPGKMQTYRVNAFCHQENQG